MPELEPNLEEWDNTILFRNILASAEQGLVGVEAYSRLPQRFDIGPVTKRCQELIDHTSASGKECALMIKYDPIERKVILNKDGLIVGEGNTTVSLNFNFTIGNLAAGQLPTPDVMLLHKVIGDEPSRVGQHTAIRDLFLGSMPANQVIRKYARRPVGSIHTHPSNSSFSPDDIAVFLEEAHTSLHLLAKPDGSAEALLLSRDTPLLASEDINANLKIQHEQIQARLQQVTVADPQLDVRDAVRRALAAMTKTLSKRYKIGYYTSPADHLGKFERVV